MNITAIFVMFVTVKREDIVEMVRLTKADKARRTVDLKSKYILDNFHQFFTGYPAKEVLEKLRDAINSYDKGEMVYFDVEPKPSCSCCSDEYELSIHGVREETDEEYEERLNKIKMAKKAYKEERRRAEEKLYRELKKKFGE